MISFISLRSFIIYSLCFFFSPLLAAGEALQNAIDIRLEGQQEGINSQQKIDQLAQQKRDMLQEFENSTLQIGDLRVYNDQLERLIKKQRQELASFDSQLRDSQEAEKLIVPMMLKMVKVLDQFIQLDSPFLKQERQLRVKALREMLDQPTMNNAEKYRRILEAYQIETDYGRTIEAYSGNIIIADENRSVEFLRIGRVALLYTNSNGSEIGQWDKQSKQWKPLPSTYKNPIKQGIRMAKKEAPPELIKLPLSLTKLAKGE